MFNSLWNNEKNSLFFGQYSTMNHQVPYITNDAVVLGILMLILSAIFYTSSIDKGFWYKFYRVVPSLLLCYFIPALFNWPLGLISGDMSGLYKVSTNYLLPASLILLCLSIDFKGLMSLGSKSLIMFLAGTAGVVIGGPVAYLSARYLFPDIIPVDADLLWKGMSTIAGSWIGGSANQTAMKEIYQVPDNLFGTMLVVDVIVANIWMGCLLYGAGISDRMDKFLKADASSLNRLKSKIESLRAGREKLPSTAGLIMMMGITFAGVGLSHFLADKVVPLMEVYKDWLNANRLSALNSGFFWIVVFATTVGLALSFTPARHLEDMGASKWGSVFIYILVATIGMKMNLGEVLSNPGLFLLGLIWMLTHAMVMILVARFIKAPFFYLAVGSQANIGGAASAPVVASAFSPVLAPVGVIMAVLGYALGTYGAIICAQIMAEIS